MLLAVLLGCEMGGPIRFTEAEREMILTFGRPGAIRPRPSNAVADDPRAAALGESLFFDEGLSIDNQTSCASCHVPELRFTDGERLATAIGTGTRNTPTIESSAWQTWFYWDGRADSGWAQATNPLLNPKEHGLSAERLRERVVTWHLPAFTEVFGPPSEDPQRVLAQVGMALEAFERTLAPPESAFDRYVAALAAGRDEGLDEPARRGLRLFIGQANCVSCHHGPLMTDHTFHVLGLPTGLGEDADLGRATGAVTVLADPFNCLGPFASTNEGCEELRFLDPTFEDWKGAFKTPTLRGVAATAPYMHDGSLPTLSAVLQHYNALPGEPKVGHRELTLRPLQLSSEQLGELEAFLVTL